MPNQRSLDALTALSTMRARLSRMIVIPPRLQSKLSAEDILQEIARTLLRTSLTADYTETTWLYAIMVIAKRQITKQLRIAKRSTQLENDDIQFIDATPDQNSDLLLFEILDHCTERQRRIVLLRWEGHTLQEIALREGLNEGTIRRQISQVERLIEEGATHD
jgi:RNA polymerase sigma factor (sigma-70 family)